MQSRTRDQKGELYGRALVVIAAEQYATRMVLPASQRTYRTYRTQWGSHKDLAAKALRKLAGPHLPASLKQLERAVARANKHAEDAQHSQPGATRGAIAVTGPVQNEPADDGAVNEDAEGVNSDEPGEPAAGV
jgi:hypothetical protein